jgi:hypothetical protein
MDKAYIYEICFEGQLAESWSDWFAGLALSSLAEGVTILEGPLQDQAALFGVLCHIHDLNLVLVSVARHPIDTFRPA